MLQHRHTCPKCGRTLSFEDRQCPFCGAEIHKKLNRRKLSFLLAAALILLAILLIFREDIQGGIRRNRIQSRRHTESLEESGPVFPYYEVPLSQAAGEDCSYFWEDIDARYDYLMTLPEQEQEAFREACWAMDTPGGVSRKSYINGMRFRGFDEEKAEAMLTHLQPDWNHEALKAALFIFRGKGNSKKEVEDVLEYMGFLPEEIQYAMDRCKPDYGQQAAIELQDWLRISSFSRRDCQWHLEDRKFTEEEIQWALDHSNIDWKEMAYCRGLNYGAVTAADRENLAERLRQDGFSQEEIRYAAEKLKVPLEIPE